MNLHLVTRAEPLLAGAARAGRALRLLTGVRTTRLCSVRRVFYPAALIRAAGRRHRMLGQVLLDDRDDALAGGVHLVLGGRFGHHPHERLRA